MSARRDRVFIFGLVLLNVLLILFTFGFIWNTQSSINTIISQTNPTTINPPRISTHTPYYPPKTTLPASVTAFPVQQIPTATISPTALPENSEWIGTSLGGRPILIYRFGQGQNERLIVAGIHGGNEYNTVLLAEQLIQYLYSHPTDIPKDKTLYILPDLNPDGLERSWDIYGRANDHGVDLNHNFPYRWSQNWNHENCWHYLDLNGGQAPASEPETQALMGFILSHPIKALISYHSAAMGIFPGGNPPFPPSLSLARTIAQVSHYPYPPLDSGCDYTGNLTDWAATLGIASVDIELTNHRETDFEQNLSILHAFLHW